MSYICEDCKWNNNGWCKKIGMNGLKKKNIQECDDYSSTGETKLSIYKKKR